MNWSMISCVMVLIGVFTGVLVQSRWYQSGLIFYDLSTKQMILPPTVSIHRARSLQIPGLSIFSTMGKPCTCKGLECGCCAGLEVREYNFNQKMCANVTFVPEKKEAVLDVFLDEMSKARYGVSARNPSPICVPIMMPIPMAACIQMSQVGLKGDNLHMCMDFVMRLHSTDAMELHFNCLSMGLDGLQYLDPNGNPVLPREDGTVADEGNSIDDEYYDSAEESQEIVANDVAEDSVNDEESSDDQNKVIENDEYEYYEDVEDSGDKDVDEVTKKGLEEESSNAETYAKKNFTTKDNLIIVYETE